MSVDIDWQSLTTGPEGLALAESIREFIHTKFQQVELPRFIRSVQVHSFDFGKECPIVKLKDICDPLPEFYENEEDDEEEKADEDECGEVKDENQGGGEALNAPEQPHSGIIINGFSHNAPLLSPKSRPNFIDIRPTGQRSNLGIPDHIATPFLSRSNTPGIPGGTSNLSYFHLPLGAGLSGSQTPLAAVAGGTSYSTAWDHHHFPSDSYSRYQQHHHHDSDPSSRPSTAASYTNIQSPVRAEDIIDGSIRASATNNIAPDPMDTQIVLHISYIGTVRLSITAEILLDYPMPSFVGIPLKLNITGLSFDGVALIAYVRKRAHFCFLCPDDARILVGVDGDNHSGENMARQGHEGHSDLGDSRYDKLGGLLREIRVESEIGRKEGGKQVLKNVGKVEKFVLEQVRRIFEDEFVWPSFWTFLV